MHGRGCSKRHTVGCTDDLSASGEQLISEGGSGESGAAGGTSGAAVSGGNGAGGSGGGGGGGGRTRRSGLLTVMERPPGK